MNHSYKYEYEGITLCPLGHADIELLRTWRNDSRNVKYLRKIPYITSEMQEKWYSEYFTDPDIIMFSIIENTLLHRMVGSISLYNFADQETVELGKVLVGDSEAHGKRVGVRAVIAATKIAQAKLNKDAIILHVDVRNIPAVKIYRQAGFEEYFKSENEMLMKYKG